MIQSVDRAMKLMYLIAEHKNGIGVRELARLTDLKVSTAQNLLKTLVASGVLHTDPVSRRYGLGLEVIRIVRENDWSMNYAVAAVPVVRQLTQEFLGAVSVSVYNSNQFYRIVNANFGNENGLVVSTAIEPTRLGASSAGGSAILAFQDKSIQTVSITEELSSEIAVRKDITTTEDYEKEYECIRQQGYAENIGSTNEYLAAFAVPIFRVEGGVQMSLTMSMSMPLYERTTKEKIVAALQQAVEEIAESLL